LASVDFKTKDYKDYLSESKKTALLLQDQNQLRIVAAGEKGFEDSGGTGMMRAILRVQKELYDKGNFDAYELASTYCLLGDKQDALNLLQIAVAKREERVIGLRSDYKLDALHDEPSFRKMIGQVGLPPLQ
jgi:hypothetical protein